MSKFSNIDPQMAMAVSSASVMNELTQNLETNQLIFWPRHDMDEGMLRKCSRDCISQLPAGRCTAAQWDCSLI